MNLTLAVLCYKYEEEEIYDSIQYLKNCKMKYYESGSRFYCDLGIYNYEFLISDEDFDLYYIDKKKFLIKVMKRILK